MKKFVTAAQEAEALGTCNFDGHSEEPHVENDQCVNWEDDRGPGIPYDLDGRKMTAYRPHEGQLTFMLAALGRGQTNDQRYAAIVNIMMASHEGDDQDHLESRLLSNRRSERLRLKQLEEIFEFLIAEWFADPTQEPSDSAELEPSASRKSPPRTTKSTT